MTSPIEEENPPPHHEPEDKLFTSATLHSRLRLAAPYIVVMCIGLALGSVLSSDSTPTPSTVPVENVSADAVWTCSMHPQIQSPEPGTCPICGMDLITTTTDGHSSGQLAAHAIRLTPRAQALARIQTAQVVPTVFEGSTRALLGQVSSDESSLKAVTAWIGGRVDKLYVSTTGERVKRGQAMAKIYSPQVYAAHQNLLAAVAQVARLGDVQGYARDTAMAQVESARQRLRLLGFRDSDLTSMEKAKAPWTQVTIRSAASGTVMARRIRAGEYITQGAVLFEVADLEHVWVELDAYESDLAMLTQDQAVELSFDALEDGTIMGKVAFIDPVVDPRTRVAKVRVEVPNLDGRLKPGMYARAKLEPGMAQAGSALALVIPRSAPLYAGERALVYVEQSSDAEGAIYEAREVILGPAAHDHVVVRAGLERGERVVTHGAFVLDSDLQIRGKLSLMARPDDTQRDSSEPMLTLDATQRAALMPVVEGYLDMQELLAADKLAQSIERASRWRTQIEGIELTDTAGKTWRIYERLFSADLEPLTHVESLAEARTQFSLITQTLDRFLAQFGNVSDQPLRRAYCPMVHDNQGDHWYQRGSTVDNVYFGEQMRTCGEIREVLRPGGHLMPDSNVPASQPGQGGEHVHTP